MFRPKFCALVAALVAAGGATASVDTSPKPGGVYRLKPGIYVQEGIACRFAPNAAIREYNGRGFNTAHTRECRARVLSYQGQQYRVSQSCLDAGAGPASRFTERQTVAVQDALTFSLRTTAAATTYRYCPINMLPAGMQRNAG